MIDDHLQFKVLGEAVGQGSVRAFAAKNGKAFVRQGDSAAQRQRLGDWRTAIADGARRALGDTPGPLEEGPVTVAVSILLPKPKSAPKYKRFPTAKPDIDKLGRAILDALSGVVFADDAQVVSLTVSKAYAIDAPPQAELLIVAIGERERVAIRPPAPPVESQPALA